LARSKRNKGKVDDVNGRDVNAFLLMLFWWALNNGILLLKPEEDYLGVD
jgi:hypothetical protein